MHGAGENTVSGSRNCALELEKLPLLAGPEALSDRKQQVGLRKVRPEKTTREREAHNKKLVEKETGTKNWGWDQEGLASCFGAAKKPLMKWETGPKQGRMERWIDGRTDWQLDR